MGLALTFGHVVWSFSLWLPVTYRLKINPQLSFTRRFSVVSFRCPRDSPPIALTSSTRSWRQILISVSQLLRSKSTPGTRLTSQYARVKDWLLVKMKSLLSLHYLATSNVMASKKTMQQSVWIATNITKWQQFTTCSSSAWLNKASSPQPLKSKSLPLKRSHPRQTIRTAVPKTRKTAALTGNMKNEQIRRYQVVATRGLVKLMLRAVQACHQNAEIAEKTLTTLKKSWTELVCPARVARVTSKTRKKKSWMTRSNNWLVSRNGRIKMPIIAVNTTREIQSIENSF